MNKKIICIGLTLFAFVYLWTADAVIIITAMDEEGRPVAGAEIIGGWSLARPPGTGWGAGPDAVVNAVSDRNGIAKLSVKNPPTIHVLKEGYYNNGIASYSNEMRNSLKNPIFSLNRPEFTIVLQRKIDPIPMYVRKIETTYPQPGQACGFDLQLGDWVAPFGKGIRADMLITVILKGTRDDDFDLDVQIIFEGQGDGLILCRVPLRGRMRELRLDRQAPLDGYQQVSSWTDFIHASPQRIAELEKNKDFFLGSLNPRYKTRSFNDTEDDNYYFKIRSTPTADGAPASPMYGKIHGSIKCFHDSMRFLYYLNPNGTRSLEWDMVHNLAGDKQLIPKEP